MRAAPLRRRKEVEIATKDIMEMSLSSPDFLNEVGIQIVDDINELFVQKPSFLETDSETEAKPRVEITVRAHDTEGMDSTKKKR